MKYENYNGAVEELVLMKMIIRENSMKLFRKKSVAMSYDKENKKTKIKNGLYSIYNLYIL